MLLNVLARLSRADDRAGQEAALRWLYGFVRPEGRAVLVLLALALSATGLALAQPWLTKVAIDQGLLGARFDVLVWSVLSMVGVGLAAMVLGGANRYLHTRLSARVLLALRTDVYAHLQQLSPHFYQEQRLGDIMARLDGDVAEIQRFALDALFAALSSLLGLVGALFLLLSLSWQLTLLMLVLLPVEVLWLRHMRGLVARDTRALREQGANVSSFLVETLPAMKFIQASGQQQRERERLTRLGDEYLARLLRLQMTEFQTQSVPTALTLLSRSAVFLLGGWWIIQGQWQLGALMAFIAYLGMAIGPVKSLLGLYVALQRMTVSLQRVMALRQAPVKVRQPAQPRTPPRAPVPLVLEAVWYRHPARSAGVLRGASAVFEAGAKIGLRGASGAGKSTLIDLLQRFDDPQQGRILLGDTDLRELDLSAWRRQVAVVAQEIVLFKGTLAENIWYGARSWVDEEQIRHVCRLAGLSGWVNTLPQGLDTPLGERGLQLSGGQRQRIAIARALLQDASILVFDEATSALDEATERQVIEAIDQLFGHCTRILISHRASTLAGVDVGFELRDGLLFPWRCLSEPDEGLSRGRFAARDFPATQAPGGGPDGSGQAVAEGMGHEREGRP
ncbi:MAG: ABC transporter ATP-binding protein [Lautropia sp.]|nr:ABC transporter ATP-binding protein [Lautropia sp.]